MYIVLIVIIVIYLILTIQYRKTDYYKQTKTPYFGVILSKEKIGEYKTYKHLDFLEGYKKYLFNLYLPKDNGETTEIDIVLLHDSGIYVFESKNYSGWIFGSETHTNWTQTLLVGRGKSQKNHFFNPIIQNKGHIKWLNSYLQNNNIPVFSCIVFSDRCTLKDIKLTSGEHAVINRNNILSTIERNSTIQGICLSQIQIDDIYNKLYPLTQVGFDVKQAHIQAIQKKIEYMQSPINSYDSIENMISNNKVCPRCGFELKIRTVTKGQRQGKRFYGCSNFPKCKYTMNITE